MLARARSLLLLNRPSLRRSTRLFREEHATNPHSQPSPSLSPHLSPLPFRAAPPIPPPSDSLTVATVGLSSGTLGGLCGIGGAVFAIPSLVRFAHMPQRVAAGNSLVAVTCISSTSALSFANAGHVDPNVALTIGVAAAVLTPIGAYAGRNVKPARLRKALGLFMLVLAPVMPLRAYIERQRNASLPSLDQSPTPFQVPTEKRLFLGAVASVFGFGSGMLGISGGSLFTPLIAVTCPDASFKAVVGTSFASMIVPTAIGAISYARMRLMTPYLIPPLIIGSITGATVGSNIALSVPEDWLRWGFATVFAVLGARILRAPIKVDNRTPERAVKAAKHALRSVNKHHNAS